MDHRSEFLAGEKGGEKGNRFIFRTRGKEFEKKSVPFFFYVEGFVPRLYWLNRLSS
jgi:hypothetical protein